MEGSTVLEVLGSAAVLLPAAVDELPSDVPVVSDAVEGKVEESVGEVFDVVVEDVDEVEDVLEVELVDEVDESVAVSSSPGVAVMVKEVEIPSSRVGVIDGENDDDEGDEVEVDEEVDVADPRVGKIDGENEEEVVGEPREGVIEGVKEVRVDARSVTEVIPGGDGGCVLEEVGEEEEEEELELDEGLELEVVLELEFEDEVADELGVEELDVALLLLLLDVVDDVEPDDNHATS